MHKKVVGNTPNREKKHNKKMNVHNKKPITC